MTTINVYDYCAEQIQKVCEDNNMSEELVMSLLIDYIGEMKLDNDLE